ncbi:HNH endonuclease [Halomicrococcus sp. SG-WS-1]|uniref:HNH endonuclease n=1 Tax=Halomicrococcus sp. SG-WS-1 TaxID=3439057 RepID=UPI003F795B80
MTAVTGCEKFIIQNAWGETYPYQVRVIWEDLYRISSSEFPQIENNETLSSEAFREIVNRLNQEGARLIIPEWGSRTAALAEDTVAKPDTAEIEEAREELIARLEEEPPDTEPVEHTTSKQIAREEAFRQTVREAYEERCAFCGIRRETPDGRPEVEAAHIRSKTEGGPDDIRNGIALCKLHHWAYDNGWLSVTTDYEISVSEAPSQDGYQEFKKLAGEKIWLPDDDRMYPALKYLE